MTRVTNDTELTPRVVDEGPALAFDLPGVLVGAAEYDEGPTGCTAILLPPTALVAADLRGGAIGFTGDYSAPDAICLAAGSLLGLEAAAGVAAELHASRGYSTEFLKMPAVSGAIIYDFHSRQTPVYPDKELGRAAARSARAGWFPLGTRGAGRAAGVGQGAAAWRQGEVAVAVFTVVNALGALVDREGRVVHGGNRRPKPGAERRTLAQELAARTAALGSAPPAPGNTTLTVVVTDARLGMRDLTQLGRQVHSSMARAIQPFHTPYDGDVLWSVTTATGPRVDAMALGVLASELAWDAVLASAS
ncbi:MAG TPA: P1 family peptidase [Candidatus Dormibacteraeota bacterium]|jgi:L-aminopeptidase/D-esterase-like protein